MEGEGSVVSEIQSVDHPRPRDPADPGVVRIRKQVTQRVQGKPDPVLR